LQRLAREGSIYVSEAVRQQAEGFFRFNDTGACTVPGLAQPVRVYECTGVGQVTSRLAAALRRRVSQFVGREGEMALLHTLWTKACHGQGQVACLFGEAGIGKSRLAFEARDTLTGGRLLEAQTLSYGQQTPYHAIVPLVRALLAVSGDAAPHEQRQQLRTRLEAMHPALASDEPLLAHLLGLPVEPDQLPASSPEEHRRRLQQACLQVLGHQATGMPLCLCIEDLHWLDPSSQEVLDTLVTSLARLPILLLGTARPGFRHTWADHTYFHQLTIEPLTDEHTDALIRDFFRPYDASTALKALIRERTEGNPFFVEELLRTLQEQELVALQDEVYALKAGAHVEIPASIQGVVAARIDRLSAEAKWCLQAAAVIGREVPFPLLHALTDLPEDALHRHLEQLRTAEFLYETRFFPDHAYTFKHALTHEVAYESLLRERRRTLHARIVGIIEALDAERRIDQIERLAYHALWGEVWDKAVTYSRQAGVQAAMRSANREAVAGFEQALAALRRLPDTRETRAQAIDLRFDLRNTLLLLGEHEKIFDYMREAEVLARSLDDNHRHAQVSAYLCTYFFTAGNYDHAIASGEHALAITTALGDFPLHVDLNFRLGQVYHAIGAYHRAMTCLRRNVESLTGELLYTRFGQGFLVSVFSRAWLVWCLAEVGEFDEGLMRGEEGI
jgi:predicted ATPase